jgi:hypothetical protein
MRHPVDGVTVVSLEQAVADLGGAGGRALGLTEHRGTALAGMGRGAAVDDGR